MYFSRFNGNLLFMHHVWLSKIIIIVASISFQYYVVHGVNETKPVILWAGSGGGWRAMVSHIGFTNTFKNAGLLDLDNKKFHIKSMSTNSGGTWALAQLAYSQSFFDMAVPRNTSDLYPFIIDWMNSLRTFINDNYHKYHGDKKNDTMLEACKLLSPLNINPTLEDFENLCLVITRLQFSWTNAIDQMYVYTSNIVFNDPSFNERVMNETNRIPIFQNTDLSAQIAVMPVSKIVDEPKQKSSLLSKLLHIIGLSDESSKNLISYIGPANSNTEGFTVPIPCQYYVSSNRSGFVYGIRPSQLPFKVYSGPAPKHFKFSDWKNYYFYNKTNVGTILTELPSDVTKEFVPYTEPFNNGVGTVTQISSASSASLIEYTGIIPSFLSQFRSVQIFTIQNNNNLTIHEKRKKIRQLFIFTNVLYKADFLKDIAVCSKWPNPCLKNDYLLVDGADTDGPSMALNVAQYQQQNLDTYKNTTLKVILTNHNTPEDQNPNLLWYFSTYFNQGVLPGDYIWPPGIVFGEPAQRNPMQSMQIFQDYLDDKTLNEGFTPVNLNPNEYWNITTGIFNCTTIDNPAAGVLGGQKVQLMLIRINSVIPTNQFTNSLIDKWTIPLASMALDIATDPVLISRIREFSQS